MKKYKLSVGAIFQNEHMIIKEWIEHYFLHGVEHFYLINDSTDGFYKILSPYWHLVTVYRCDIPRVRGRQVMAYQKYFTPILNDSEWFAVCDLDEYIYSPYEISIPKVLMKFENEPIIVLKWAWFGSNGHFEQPESIVRGFTRRAELGAKFLMDTPDGRMICDTEGRKPIINTRFQFNEWKIHYDGNSYPDLIMNHYPIMSLEYFINYKMKRDPCCNNYRLKKKDKQYFIDSDINEVEDLRLAQQNFNI